MYILQKKCNSYRLKCKFYRKKCKSYRLKCKINRLKCKFYRLECKFYRKKMCKIKKNLSVYVALIRFHSLYRPLYLNISGKGLVVLVNKKTVCDNQFLHIRKKHMCSILEKLVTITSIVVIWQKPLPPYLFLVDLL